MEIAEPEQDTPLQSPLAGMEYGGTEYGEADNDYGGLEYVDVKQEDVD